MSILQRFRLDGRTALVTGSARGIGRAIALGLAECGATVCVHGVKPADALESSLKQVRELSPRSAAVTGDLSEIGAAARIYADAQKAVGDIDILVINASVQIRRPWAQIPQDEAQQQMQVNFISSLQLIQAAAPAMLGKKWGRILAIGSVQESRPHPDMVVYAATKSAQENMVRNLAKQLGPGGVTVNNLAPGVITTDRNAEALSNPDYAQRVRQLVALRSFGASEDCVGAALLLCSNAGQYITGETIYVDGGLKL